LKDRQAVFKGDCAKCHVEPAVGRTGQALFEAACAICHESPHRATMVTDLRALKVAPTPEYWQAMISHGKPNTLMPAFLQSEGGPLTEEQVKSLVDYMTHYYPPRASVSAPSPYHDD
jgi:mono/diheme cytochrome c family protein